MEKNSWVQGSRVQPSDHPKFKRLDHASGVQLFQYPF